MFSAIFDRSELRAALAFAKPVIERRNTLPVLSCVEIRASANGGAFLRGTDLDLQTTIALPNAGVDADFRMAINHATLADLERKAVPTDHVAIDAPTFSDPATWERDASGKPIPQEPDATHSLVDFEGLRCKIQPQSPYDFPELAIEGAIHADFTIETEALAKALNAVEFAVSTEETRYYLNGVYMHVVSRNGVDVLSFVATDGHRMAVHDMPMPEGVFDGMPGVIIPRKTVAYLSKLFKAKTAPDVVRVQVNTVKARFTVGIVDVITKLVDGSYPDYQRVIPSYNENVLTGDRAALLAGVKAVAAMAGTSKAVKLSPAGGAVTLSIRNGEGDSAEMSVPCTFEGEAPEIGFNSAYLAEVLDNVAGDTVRIGMDDSRSPAIITGDDPATRFVLMPYRV